MLGELSHTLHTTVWCCHLEFSMQGSYLLCLDTEDMVTVYRTSDWKHSYSQYCYNNDIYSPPPAWCDDSSFTFLLEYNLLQHVLITTQGPQEQLIETGTVG